MAAASFGVSGFGDLDRKLAIMERTTDKRRIAAALFAGAKVIGDEERRQVPKRTGTLERSIIETMQPANLPTDGMTIYIGPSTGGSADGWYGSLVHWGTSDTPANPFASRAVALKGEQALNVVASRLRADVLDRAA
jgi:HK97 gp10 family phage protein